VRDGRAAYERDGWAFVAPRSNRPLLAALLTAARTAPGAPVVLDFGGALGSLYWQHREELRRWPTLSWRVVEQDHYVAAGRKEFLTETLSFWPDVNAACDGAVPDLVIASSVVQYLPEPYDLIRELLEHRPRFVFVDRTPLLAGAEERLTVEHVPPELGGGSYPAWFLSEDRFLAAFDRHRLVERFETRLEGDVAESWDVFGRRVPNQGFLFARIEPPSAAS
jgi:putative methyltransferase (TIGR04325 family)